MPYKEMECPECKGIWKGNIPESRVKVFYERCQHCNKVVKFKEVQECEIDFMCDGNKVCLGTLGCPWKKNVEIAKLV